MSGVNQPLISVIVPVYKVEKYLNRCVDSIIKQTYKNIEIILVEDGSPDACPEICDALADKDSRVRVIHKTNGGLSSARNAGIDVAKGEYIGFVDSDDFIDKDMYSRLFTLISLHNADVAMIKYVEVTDDSFPKKIDQVHEMYFRGIETESAFLKLRVESVCVGLYSRNAIGGTRFQVGKTSEDIPFNFEVFKNINSFVYAPENRYYYYYNPNSISNGKLNGNMFNLLHFREEIYKFYKGNDRLLVMAEVLYARASMALLTRMAIFGVSDDLREDDCKSRLQDVFREHKSAYFKSSDIPLSRKILGFAVLYCYPIIKLLRGVKK